jgi:tetratricopeptide (TPR) repeat protein
MKLTETFALLVFILLLFNNPAFAQKKIAVLPFEVLNNQSELQYFGVGTMDSITNALSHVPEFTMIDRSQLQSVMKEIAFQNSGFTDQIESIKLGKQLGAEILVFGTIQSFNNKYRITARFTEVETGKINNSFQVTGTDLFDLQDQLASEILKQEDVKINPEQKEKINKITKATSDFIAYDDYIKGRSSFFLYTVDDFYKAINYFDKSIESDPNYILPLAAKAETQAILAFELMGSQDLPGNLLSDSEENAQIAIKKNPNLGEAHRALSIVFHIRGKRSESMLEAKKAIEINPNDGEAYYWLWANTERKTDDPLIKKSIELNPYFIPSHVNLGNALSENGNYEEAIVEFNKALKYSPDSLDIHLFIGEAYLEQKNYQMAINEFNKPLEKDNKYILSHIYLFDLYKRQGNSAEAIKELERGIEIKPDNIFCLVNLVKMYQEINNKEKENEVSEKILKITPDKSLFDFNAYFPGYDVLIILADIYYKKGKTEEAIGIYLQLAKYLPKSKRIKKNLSAIYFDLGLENYKNGEIGISISYYQESLKYNPNDTNTHNNLGLIYFNQGKTEEAIKEYKEALQINPNDINANDNLGIAFEKLGNKEEAIKQYKKACELGDISTCKWINQTEKN